MEKDMLKDTYPEGLIKSGVRGKYAMKFKITITAREFRETVTARVKRDPKFHQAMFTEAINACLSGDTRTGKAILSDLVNATIGFEGLAAATKKPSKSLHRMLAPRGNPNTENFFDIVSALQKKTRVRLQVTALAN